MLTDGHVHHGQEAVIWAELTQSSWRRETEVGVQPTFRGSGSCPDRKPKSSTKCKDKLDLEMSPNRSQETDQGGGAVKAVASKLRAIKTSCGHQVGPGVWAQDPEAVAFPYTRPLHPLTALKPHGSAMYTGQQHRQDFKTFVKFK